MSALKRRRRQLCLMARRISGRLAGVRGPTTFGLPLLRETDPACLNRADQQRRPYCRFFSTRSAPAPMIQQQAKIRTSFSPSPAMIDLGSQAGKPDPPYPLPHTRVRPHASRVSFRPASAMSERGHLRPGLAGNKLGHVRCAAESGSKRRALAAPRRT